MVIQQSLKAGTNAAMDGIVVRDPGSQSKPVHQNKQRTRWDGHYTPNCNRAASRSGSPAAMIFFWVVAIS